MSETSTRAYAHTFGEPHLLLELVGLVGLLRGLALGLALLVLLLALLVFRLALVSKPHAPRAVLLLELLRGARS
jgi:hypothetical protein